MQNYYGVIMMLFSINEIFQANVVYIPNLFFFFFV